jgi:hypothetical protein
VRGLRTRSVQSDRIDQQIADDREQKRDQRAGDGNTRVHHPLEYFVHDILRGDMTGQRIADPLDIAFESLQFRALIIDFRPS